MAGDRLSELGAHRQPDAQHHELRVDMRERPGSVGRPAGRAAGVAKLGQQERRAGLRPRRLDERVDGFLRQIPQRHRVDEARDRFLRLHVHRDELRGRHRPEQVHDRIAQLAQRGDHLGALRLGARIARAERDQRAVAERLGDLRQRGQVQEPGDRSDLVGNVPCPVAVAVKDLSGALVRGVDDASGEDLRELDQPELDRGHDPEASAPTAQRPEEVGIGVGIDPAQLAVGGHQLDRAHAVAGQAVAPRQPAEPAPGRVTDDAHVRRGAREGRQAVVSRGVAGIAPDHPRLEAADAPLGVDLDSVHALGLDQDHPVEGAAARDAVSRALGDHPHAVRPRERDHGRDVFGALDVRHRRGALVNCQVPGRAGLVPVLLAGSHRGAAKTALQRLDVDGLLLHGLQLRPLSRSPRQRATIAGPDLQART